MTKLSENTYISWGVVLSIVAMVVWVVNSSVETKTTLHNHINDPALHHNINDRVNANFVTRVEFESRLDGIEQDLKELKTEAKETRMAIKELSDLIIESLK